MKILKIIHGYPPLYNAGSEVYSRTLCAELSNRHEVHVFTREENLFARDGELRQEQDSIYSDVTLHIVNAARVNINYKSNEIDEAFAKVAKKINPDVAHIGHLNHLSLGIVDVLAKLEIPIVYTLHDYWLLCLRGQFVQIEPAEDSIWPLCNGQEDSKCAVNCLSRFTGDKLEPPTKLQKWVSSRMAATKRVMELTDLFISPSQYLMKRFIHEAPTTKKKIQHLDYGFDLSRLSNRMRNTQNKFTFGYIGTHIPTKGVQHLIEAFSMLDSEIDCELHIWGAKTNNTINLIRIAEKLPSHIRAKIHWRGEYQNEYIVEEVLNHIDAVITPSIWEENSPLVIHEAQQARLPVITANMGGMSEYVRHEENGLLFTPRSPHDLSLQMARLSQNPDFAHQLGQRGYLYSDSRDVPDIKAHSLTIEGHYKRVIKHRERAKINVSPAPWRITFDTNPDHCNYQCTMCEEHSPYSTLQFHRKANRIRKRVMPFEIISRNVQKMAKNGLREIIPSTMGEPLLYKNFEDIIDLCKKHNIMLNLTTNGSFPRLGVDKWAHLLVPVSSDIKISWNGAKKETHEKIMENSSWDEMLANAHTLASIRDLHAASGGNRCSLTLQMTFMESNYTEIPDLIRLAANLGFDRVKGHHLWAHFAEIKEEDMRRNHDSIHRWNEIVDKAHATANEHRLPSGSQVRLDNISHWNVETHSATGKCPFLGKEAWISAVGRFDPCCAPDAERRSLGDFGNLHEMDFIDIWNGDAYQLLTKTYHTRDVCLKCNMREHV